MPRRPGFARIFEAMSGFTQICGEEDGRRCISAIRSPTRSPACSAPSAPRALYRSRADSGTRGQEIDCSATEAMLRTLEFLAIEYDQLGVVRTRSGNRSQYAAPGNIYANGDGNGRRSRRRRRASSSGCVRRSSCRGC